MECLYYTYGSTANFLFLGPTVLTYVTVHAERDHKSAIVILRYGGVRQKRRILSFSIFFAQGMRKAL